MYKAQVLSYVESGTPALYHAAASVVAGIDHVKLRFQREIGSSEFEDLSNFRFASIKSRRDMAMLGILHK